MTHSLSSVENGWRMELGNVDSLNTSVWGNKACRERLGVRVLGTTSGPECLGLQGSILVGYGCQYLRPEEPGTR